MDRTSFADPEAAQFIEQNFVPIRVDTDMRPDISSRYNMEGWPTVAFLTPDGEVLIGGTYMPPAAFKDTLHRINDFYHTSKADIQRRVVEFDAQRAVAPVVGDARVLTASIEDAIYWSIVSNYDEEFGGFGPAPKFPQTEVLELLLARYQRTGDSQPLRMVTTTLSAMAQGGICDQEAGGFFRYSTMRDWSAPHREKMLEDNARLLNLYLHAYQITYNEQFRATAEGILSYVESTLRQQRGDYFGGSQAADEEYYALSMAEREEHIAPFVDTQAYTSWNAMMTCAYLNAAVALGRPELADVALTTLRFLWKHLWLPDQGMCHYWDGAAHLPGLLTDQVWMAQALLDAFEYEGAREYLEQAQEIMNWVYVALRDEQGCFRDAPVNDSALGRLGSPEHSMSENAVAAAVLTRLTRLTSDVHYGEWARLALIAFADRYGRYAHFAASYALAASNLLTEPLRVVVVGGSDDQRSVDLLRAAWQPYAANRILLLVDPLWDTERLHTLGYPEKPVPAAYICLKHACAESTSEPSQVIATIERLFQSGDQI
jgi:uncharacterized protein YyaL (SSP411 family)